MELHSVGKFSVIPAIFSSARKTVQLGRGNQGAVLHFQHKAAIHHVPARIRFHLPHGLDFIVQLGGGEGDLGQNGPLIRKGIEQKLLIRFQVGGAHHGIQGDFHGILPAHEAHPQLQGSIHGSHPFPEAHIHLQAAGSLRAGDLIGAHAAAVVYTGGLDNFPLVAHNGVRPGAACLHQVIRHLVPPHLPVELPVGAAVHQIVHRFLIQAFDGDGGVHVHTVVIGAVHRKAEVLVFRTAQFRLDIGLQSAGVPFEKHIQQTQMVPHRHRRPGEHHQGGRQGQQ